jgi:vancomycin resistance protein YoaR
MIGSALMNGTDQINLQVPYTPLVLRVQSGATVTTLSVLATGRSNFTGSPDNRVHNVHKAVNERENNVVVLPGQKFSFVDTLGGPVTLDKGWVEGLGLFGGGAAFTPGAGICQAATTVYRAALLAGLPIVEKRNHSMFVDHYEPYGVGLDATVFPGFHDLRFLNNTKNMLVIQAYTQGDDVYVNVFGIPDGRTVQMDGPYFWRDTKAQRPAELRSLAKEEIGWVRRVTFADGHTESAPLIADYYKGFFRKVITTYTALRGQDILHHTAEELQGTL